MWQEISPILWQLLDHLETLLGGSALDTLLQGQVSHQVLPPPWTHFLRRRLTEDKSEERLLSLVAELSDLRQESEFWQFYPKLQKVAEARRESSAAKIAHCRAPAETNNEAVIFVKSIHGFFKM